MTLRITAILLAAGESRRMGRPKLLLPWGQSTVLGTVVKTFSAAGIDDIRVVTGGAREPVEDLVRGLAKTYPVQAIFNPDYAEGEMLSSIQAGLMALGPEIEGALIGLGDQPQVHETTIRAICAAFLRTRATLVFPSYENRRGHPWLASHAFWGEIIRLSRGSNPREFINHFEEKIEYVKADASILKDLDTREDYGREQPGILKNGD